jgi:hypothetical protein
LFNPPVAMEEDEDEDEDEDEAVAVDGFDAFDII